MEESRQYIYQGNSYILRKGANPNTAPGADASPLTWRVWLNANTVPMWGKSKRPPKDAARLPSIPVR